MKRLFAVVWLALLLPLSSPAWNLPANEFDMGQPDKRGHIVWSGLSNTLALYGCENTMLCTLSPEQVSGLVLVAWWLKGPTYDTWKAKPTGTSPGDGLADVIGVGATYIGYKLHRHFFPKSPVMVAPVVSDRGGGVFVAGRF